MSSQDVVGKSGNPSVGDLAREQLLRSGPLVESRMEVAGVSTAVLRGGEGPPVVLLHGQGGWAGVWMPVAPGLMADHHVVVPDLPGLGASTVPAGPPNPDLVMAWLAELIEQCCATAPVLVGISLGGSIAARFAARHGDRIASLVLVDAGGLAGPVRPRPEVLVALIRQTARPTHRNTTRLLDHLTVDLAQVRRRMGLRWDPFVAYLTDRASTASVRQANRQLLKDLGLAAIPPEELNRIDVPTSLIWGRHDRVMSLRGARKASARYGWPLHVIDGAGHLCLVERPEAVLKALLASLGEDRA